MTHKELESEKLKLENELLEKRMKLERQIHEQDMKDANRKVLGSRFLGWYFSRRRLREDTGSFDWEIWLPLAIALYVLFGMD